MLNKAIINAIIKSASVENKNEMIRMFIDYVHKGKSYNDDKCNHILEMLVDKTTIKTNKDVDIDYIKENPQLLMWNYEKYNIRDIELDRVNNIDETVVVKFKYIEKINEDNENCSYNDNLSDISYIDNPKVLK